MDQKGKGYPRDQGLPVDLPVALACLATPQLSWTKLYLWSHVTQEGFQQGDRQKTAAIWQVNQPEATSCPSPQQGALQPLFLPAHPHLCIQTQVGRKGYRPSVLRKVRYLCQKEGWRGRDILVFYLALTHFSMNTANFVLL